MKYPTQDKLWAGTEASLSMHLQQVEAGELKMASAVPTEEETPPFLEVSEGIGVISIKGPLTNRSEWWLSMMGITSYNAIREALVSAAGNPEVKQILLDIDSGGGAVNGVADISALIESIDTKVKPVIAFTDGMMCSAAYWIGASAREVYASKVATVGSIGVISTHMEYSKQLKDDGIGVTVMRSGKYKALANSAEPLTETAKDQLQEHLDEAYQVFVQHIADARSVSYEVADKTMAQGREFFGKQAAAAGLIEEITTFDSLFSRLSADSIDKKTHVVKNRVQQFNQSGMSGSSEVNMAGRQALTEQQIAALAETAAATGEATADPIDQAGTQEPAQESEGAEVANAAEAKADAAPEAAAAPDNSQLVSYLQSQVKERDDALVQTKVQLATLTEKLASAEAVVGDLTAIAAKSLNNMQVALGGSALDMSTASPVSVITEHKRVSAQFVSSFKAGGVAAVDAAQADKATVSDPRHMARVNAARFTK